MAIAGKARYVRIDSRIRMLFGILAGVTSIRTYNSGSGNIDLVFLRLPTATWQPIVF